mmetsp:Transcript_61290/g.193056  ORF Transcript_61290/g.193056 Transcript_61290/m.193056 type:complete len:237 (-) Transcript_61290:99-809(-)
MGIPQVDVVQPGFEQLCLLLGAAEGCPLLDRPGLLVQGAVVEEEGQAQAVGGEHRQEVPDEAGQRPQVVPLGVRVRWREPAVGYGDHNDASLRHVHQPNLAEVIDLHAKQFVLIEIANHELWVVPLQHLPGLETPARRMRLHEVRPVDQGGAARPQRSDDRRCRGVFVVGRNLVGRPLLRTASVEPWHQPVGAQIACTRVCHGLDVGQQGVHLRIAEATGLAQHVSQVVSGEAATP